MGLDYFGALYAMSVASGGVIGYVKAGSTGSLAAGLTFGCLLAIGVYQTSVDEKNYFFSFIVSATLGIMMGYRFINSGKFMPAGLIATISGVRVIWFVYKNMLST